MSEHKYTRPFYIFLLMLPTGISAGFTTVALPYLLTQNGFSVEKTAGIVAVGVSASLLRFILGPIVDLSLSIRKWYWISLFFIIVTLLILSLTPFTISGAALLTIIVFLSQIAVNIMYLPVTAIIAKNIKKEDKGKASGWFQAGGLAGSGLGGGAGLFLAIHYNASIAGIIMSCVCLLFAMIVLQIQDSENNKEQTILIELKEMSRSILNMIKVPASLFVIILIAMPIGTGAAANLWSAIAKDWRADVDTVAFITGILSGIISALGCILGGYIIDRWGIWSAYLGCGIICAIVTFLIALLPFNPEIYSVGVLVYAFTMGMMYSSFTAVILYGIGTNHIATKYSLLGSLGNLPVVLMTSYNGWMHDKFDSQTMLIAESIIGIVFTLIFIILLKILMKKELIPTSLN
jgi:MFS transporter, PAT family, beta-lactamase induction signal transducer AmpG